LQTLELTSTERTFCLNLLKLFKLDGESADKKITEGQLLIFAALVLRKSNRIHIMTSTQYGKSLIVALACVILSCIDGEMISIPAPTEDKAKIIMRYYLQHIGDHPLFYSQLDKKDKLDKLLMETTKDRLILNNRGGVFILSVQATNAIKGFQAAMGEGSRIVIQDESALIPDPIESTVFRMIAGKNDAMYVKIGNPFYRNHFYKSSKDERYLKIFVDYKQGIKEGRYNIDFIEEARTKPNFDILFACEFPAEDKIGIDGYQRLLTDRELEATTVQSGKHSGYIICGIDPAAGGDNSAIVIKSGNLQEIVFNQKLQDTMDLVGKVMDINQKYGVDMNIVDKTGVGQGIYDRIRELNFPVKGVAFGEKSEDPMFANLKADLHWRERKWLLSGGRLVHNYGWNEFEIVRYKNKDGKLIIQPKEDLFREGIMSPNCVDAAVLTMAVSEMAVKNKQLINRPFYDQTESIYQNG